MATRTLTIINKLGLHARAAAKFVATAGQFKSQVQLGKDGRTVDGKNIMALMLLAASQGSLVTLTAQGDDADEALDALESLINRRFDEAE